MWLGLLAGLVVAVVAAAPAAAHPRPRSEPRAVTVYSSLPLQGEAEQRDIVAGERLALREADNRAGRRPVRLVSLDDASPATGFWDPDRTAANAIAAVRDDSSVAYIGEYNSGATLISVPFTNQGGLLQVSPAAETQQLTLPSPGAPGAPDRWYPTGERTFARIVPSEPIQAAALVEAMRRRGVRSLYVVNDPTPDGQAVSGEVIRTGTARGIDMRGRTQIDPSDPRPDDVAAAVRASGARSVLFAGPSEAAAIAIVRAIAADQPGVRFFTNDGVAEPSFATGIGIEAARRTIVTQVPLAPSAYPRAARRFFAGFRRRYDRPAGPYAIYGYEAMSAVLASIRAAGDDGDEREAVMRAFFAIRDRDSVLGRYSILPRGDTTLTDFGVYRIAGDDFVFVERVSARPARPRR